MNYQSYIKENILYLPPHENNDKNETKVIYSLKTLYSIEHKDIVNLSNRINSIIESGYYLKLKDNKTNIFYINQNEPLVIFGVVSRKSFSIGSHKDINCDKDTLVILCKSDDSLFLFTEDSFSRIEAIFVKPKRIISEHDPYGEEDWDEEI